LLLGHFDRRDDVEPEIEALLTLFEAAATEANACAFSDSIRQGDFH
jgi:hypothetical protein